MRPKAVEILVAEERRPGGSLVGYGGDLEDRETRRSDKIEMLNTAALSRVRV